MEKNKVKYLILDFGKVLARPSSGNWFITPNFYKILKKDKINLNEFEDCTIKLNNLISMKMETELEEYEAFTKFYCEILMHMKYTENVDDMAKKLSNDFVYNDKKYTMYEDTKENLKRLSQKYKLILLSDNWPCAFRIMKNLGIDQYFDKLYISSVYDCQKKDGILFDYPIKDYNIKPGEAIFVDDNEELVDIANEKGLKSIIMDREGTIKESKYRKIYSLNEL